ncbi:Retinoblastoma-associated protein [Dissostichus eleginoides]|uniref:Retinoblastoma-associated protein n=1 Tax=Dissostichus eleginoides TaxID=100907 RepID=A0AAD9BZ50_DISEL|nr:Retinoblastoma-associated protein [Dissostichus eleginoides]
MKIITGSENLVMERPAGVEGYPPVSNAPDEEEVGEVSNAVQDEGVPAGWFLAGNALELHPKLPPWTLPAPSLLVLLLLRLLRRKWNVLKKLHPQPLQGRKGPLHRPQALASPPRGPGKRRAGKRTTGTCQPPPQASASQPRGPGKRTSGTRHPPPQASAVPWKRDTVWRTRGHLRTATRTETNSCCKI